MNALFLLPAFFSIYYLIKGRRDLALLNVYLPCALLFPPYYNFRLPHLPPVSMAEAAMIPLGVSLLLRVRISLKKFRRMDLWVTLYLMSIAASELLRETSPKDGFIIFLGTFMLTFFPYVVGRLGIEPTLRLATVKRMILLFLCLTPAILYEYKMGQNPWLVYGERVFSIIPGAFVQLRGGHARVQACFDHAILAGILFFIAFLLSRFLTDIYKRDKTRLGATLSKLERYHAPGLLIVMFLILTGSRGPLISGLLGYSVLQITRFKNLKVGAAVIVLFLAVGGAAVYSYFDKYTSATITADMSEAQASAIYRKEMLKNYEPIIQAGGWLGWGVLSRPIVGSQISIDNAYLLTQLSYGKLGLYLFLLIAAEALASIAQKAFTFRSHEDRFFAFVLLGALFGLFESLYSVYLGASVISICFLLLGWSQSLQDSGSQAHTGSVAAQPKFRFKRVFA